MNMKSFKAVVKKKLRFRDAAFLHDLGERIRKVRVSKGYSIDRLSNESKGLNRSSLSRIERGITDPQVSTVKRIADTIGVAVLELFRFTGVNKPAVNDSPEDREAADAGKNTDAKTKKSPAGSL